MLTRCKHEDLITYKDESLCYGRRKLREGDICDRGAVRRAWILTLKLNFVAFLRLLLLLHRQIMSSGLGIR